MGISTRNRAYTGVQDEPAAPELATGDQLADQHARLRRRGVHERVGGWVVARPDDIAAALVSPSVSVAGVAAAGGAPVGAAPALQAGMARFSDGTRHIRRRGLLEQVLPAVSGLREAARQRTAALARVRVGRWDAMPLARTVPVLALADAVGVPARDVDRVGDLVGRLCDALAPALDQPAPDVDADGAARDLVALLAPVGPCDKEQTAAVVGLLFQARDATAALIGTALLDSTPVTGPDRDLATRVERSLRQNAPVQCTRRTTLEDLSLGGVTVPRGAPVWLVLAAAEQGPPNRPATFGAGPHSCPGAEHAVALALGVLDGLDRTGWRPVPGQPVRYQPRPNLRTPSTVVLARP